MLISLQYKNKILIVTYSYYRIIFFLFLQGIDNNILKNVFKTEIIVTWPVSAVTNPIDISSIAISDQGGNLFLKNKMQIV